MRGGYFLGRTHFSSRIRVIAAALILLLVSSFAFADANSAHPAKRVLILYSFDNEEGLYAGFDRVLRTQLRSNSPEHVELYTEYLDLVRFPGPEHAKDLVKLLRIKFLHQPPDLIIPVSYAALNFLLGEGKGLFHGTPIVALFNASRLDGLKQMTSNGGRALPITGVASTDEPARTLDLALRLQPDTHQVAVLVGSSSGEQRWLEELQHDLVPYQNKIAVTYLAGLPMQELLRQVTALPPHTVVLSTYFFEDGSGQFFLPEEALDLITRASRAPVYGIYSPYIRHGIVGGHMTDPEKLGSLVAGLAERVLSGEPANSVPMVIDNSAQDIVDWHELRRWKIKDRFVPAGTVELFREPSPWERYRNYIIATIALCIFESVLIIALVFSRQKRIHAERALLRQKKLSDAVIEAIPGVFFFQDESGRNLRWNKNVENLARFPPGDVQLLGNIAEDHKAITEEARQQVFRLGAASVEAEILVKEGRTIPHYISGVRVELEGKQYLAAVGVDISDRKQAEQAIRRSEEELRSLVEHSPYGIARTSVREDRFLSVNPALAKMLGYKSEAEVLALKLSRDLYFEGESRGFRAQLTRADYFSGVDFAWKRKDGKPINVRASGRRIPGSKNQEEILEVMIEDVTARRVLEEQLRQAQKMEALGQLAGSVAHDFNNLLAVIIGYCELLARAAGPDGSSRARIETIKRAGERAASLTTQLLAFSRRQVMQPRIVNLNSLVLETDKMLQRLMGVDVEHKVILDPNLGRTRADPGQIVQVIMNLAVNARDAMPRGGKLTIQTSSSTFDDVEEIQGIPVAAGHYVVLTVSDTGTGMDEKTRSRLFEPFFTTKPVGKGTGLGLATVYGIVKQSGGFIFAETELGKGTSFKVYLPQVEGAPEAVAAQAPRAEMLQSSETVLVVEDEPAFRDLLRETLQAVGFRVLVGTDGVDALQIAEQHHGPIQLLVTDVIMPQMSGPELAKCLKQVRPEIRVLYLSGYTDDKLDSVSQLDRELALMQKPFHLLELIDKIREILARTDSPAVALRAATNFETPVNRPSKGAL